jgi:hypothetical protein
MVPVHSDCNNLKLQHQLLRKVFVNAVVTLENVLLYDV